MTVEESAFKAKETQLVNYFQPIVNTLRPPTSDDRATIRDGLQWNHEDAFRHRFGELRYALFTAPNCAYTTQPHPTPAAAQTRSFHPSCAASHLTGW